MRIFRRIFFLSIFLILFSNCSFDNKTGIWDNIDTSITKKDEFKDFVTLSSEEPSFNKVVYPKKNLKITLDSKNQNSKWFEEFYQGTNNLGNFDYKDRNTLILKSKKLIGNKANNQIFFDGKNIIATNEKGNIIVYSLELQEIIFEFNFYEKKFKKIKKKIHIIIEKNIVYVSDNLGYLYAINLISKKLLWAKNYKTPFRSNIKILKDKIIISDINNLLYFINKADGESLKVIPTEESTVKNQFNSSIAIKDENAYFLNTYGTLYSINYNEKINWFFNLNQSLDSRPSNIFYSKSLVIHNNKIVIFTEPNLYIINLNSGSTSFKSSISSILNPIISGQNIFFVTNDGLLVCMNIENGEIHYSVDINSEIARYLDTKEKIVNIKSLSILNNNIFLFLNNSYVVKFDLKAEIKDIYKLPIKIDSAPIFANGSIFYLNKNNKLIILN